MFNFIKKIVGDSNDRVVKQIVPLADEIESIKDEYAALSDEQLREKTAEFRARLADGETLDDILPDAFATVREAARRQIGQFHYKVQLIGGIVLHQGKIAEMKTGEGKTLVATLPLYLNALEGKGCHLITVNDYLAKVGAGWMAPIYHMLGLSVGFIAHDYSALFDPEYMPGEIADVPDVISPTCGRTDSHIGAANCVGHCPIEPLPDYACRARAANFLDFDKGAVEESTLDLMPLRPGKNNRSYLGR